MRYLSKYLFILFLCFSTPMAFAGRAVLTDRSDVRSFINTMVNTYHFNGPYLTHLFREVKIRRELLGMVKKPKEAYPWYKYRADFLTPKRIEQGKAYWRAHSQALAQAERQYGVSPSIIVAILGVETNYGEVQGKYRVIDTLTTLAFNSSRKPYFKNELAQYLLFCREHNLNPLEVRGSYAGAMGGPQFMPTAYRTLAVKTGNEPYSDLFHNHTDIIFSVANYFKQHGWKKAQPIAVPVILKEEADPAKFANTNLTTPYDIQILKKNGIDPKQSLASNTPANLIALHMPEGKQYWLGLPNFYVITTYNASINYAMAVTQLAEILAAQKIS